jgi:hypothetical protein
MSTTSTAAHLKLLITPTDASALTLAGFLLLAGRQPSRLAQHIGE